MRARSVERGARRSLTSSLLALPSSLLALDGLTFNGGQRIETGYCPTASDRFECEVTVNAVQPNASAAVFGTVREQEPERTFAFYVRQGGDDSTVVVYGDTAHGRLFPRDKEVSLSVGPDGASWVWDGGSERLSLMPGFARDGVTPLMIGDANAARREDGILPAGTGAAMKLHRFRIWRGGLELVHDYVPCSNAVSGVLGVFDLCETAGKNPFRGLNMLSDIPYRAWGREHSSAVECVCSNAFLVLPDTTVLKGGHWYFVKDAVSCGSITVDGAAHLILGTGAKMTSSELSGDAALVIYGQPGGHGEMKVSKSDLKALTVEGGVLSVENLSANSLTVVAGTVTAANVLNGNVTIDGGSVNVKHGQTVFVNKTGQPLRRVTVAWKEGSEEGRGLRLEGLSGYGTNDIYAIDGKVYLWLPVGTHRFALSDGQTKFRYCAVVKDQDIRVEPLPPILDIGFFVNGEDVGQRAGDGWTYGTNKVLSLDGQTPFVLSGWATNNEVQVTAMTNGTTVVLSNAFVFASGRPALDVAQGAVLTVAADEILKTGNTPEELRYVQSYNGEPCVLAAPGVQVTPGALPRGDYATAEAATNALVGAYIVPTNSVAKVLVSGALLEAYRNMFDIDVTGRGSSWSLEALLTPEARTNLAETAAAATRQIPVAAIAQLKPDVTTNVTVRGCAPGFFYSLYDGWALTNIVADANATNLNVLCGADAKVVFPEVKKPSDAAGFFKVGVGVTDNVGK